MHFLHHNIQLHHGTANREVHGSFSSEELHKIWKNIQSDYEKFMINFTKSGNHNSNFTKAAIIAFKGQGLWTQLRRTLMMLMRMMLLVWRKVASVTLQIVYYYLP